MRAHRFGQDRRIQPTLEALEDRKLLYSTLSAGWEYGERITFSLVPDGTNIGGQASVLFQSLSNRGITATNAVLAFKKAAAAWEAVSNINLAYVSDAGQGLGTPGNQQGDSRFGDIRIGGVGLSSNVLATTFLPAPYNGGTLAGDILFNANQAWRINSDYDLQTVAIHEIGHSLGMGHSAISSAVMYAYYTGMKQSLTSDDVGGIQSVYGTRSHDAFDRAAPNNAPATATNLNAFLSGGQARIGGLDITTTSDNDWFVITAPAGGSGTISVAMQSTDLSLLSPKVSLYNASLGLLDSETEANSFGATATTATLYGVQPGMKFYVRAQAANGGTSGVGGYGLIVNFAGGTATPIQPPVTTVPSQPDWGGGMINQVVDQVVDDADRITGRFRNKQRDHADVITIGSLSGFGENLHGSEIAGPRGGPPAKPIPAQTATMAPVESWLAFLPADSLKTLAKLQKRGNREMLLEAIDDAIASWTAGA